MYLLDDTVPALPPTAMKVMRLANDITCPPKELAKVIGLDMVLAAKVLRLANSAYFSPRVKIGSIERATIMLGTTTVKNLAVTSAILGQMKTINQVYAFDGWGFWKHALGVASAAGALAKRRGCSREETEDCFLGGLLHNMGILIENHCFFDQMVRIVRKAPLLGLVRAEELELEGWNHCRVGKVLAEKWHLPPSFGTVMEQYYHPPVHGEPDTMVWSVHLASVICRNQGVGLVLDKTPVEVDARVYACLVLEESVEGEIAAGLEQEIQEATAFLQA
jgi:HD-like signal output (HDOD) protein